MTGTDRTIDFRDILASKQNAIPEGKRRQVTRPKGDSHLVDDNILRKEYISEAYAIVRPFHSNGLKSVERWTRSLII